MIRVICVRTGNKYSQWYEDNLKHVIDTYSGLEYDSFEVIRDNEYELQENYKCKINPILSGACQAKAMMRPLLYLKIIPWSLRVIHETANMILR